MPKSFESANGEGHKKLPFYGLTVFENKHFLCGQDWEVPIPGFFIISSKRKSITSIDDMNEEEAKVFAYTLKRARKIMKEALGIKKCYLWQNEERPPFHLWIFPRHAWMNKLGDEMNNVIPILDYAVKYRSTQKNVEEVKEAFKKAKIYADKMAEAD